ncbi:putative lipid II flippase FtsW [Effusibacillus dendaii]|uniref:Probable peptidoglycan glycosyltransferase FtsW n=1 Tax=Effusibacillus dendaii TaxID=2743772 RepID=A0A7I8DCJ8_9BACL|nr:putative lipid II flippase FtsW [Effusibacillus dendaii]BCJ86556.1 stage V sporulation protein E [Effusibacillus dendaii]
MNLPRHRPDFVILIVTLLLVSIGLLSIYSASIIWAYQELDKPPNYFFVRQCIWAFVGLIIMLVIMNLPFWRLRKPLKLLIPLSFVMLLMVFLFPGVNGAHRWIYIGSNTIQPSEIAVLTLVIYLSHLLTKKQDVVNNFKKTVVPVMAIAGFFSGLILLEPDMDTAALPVVVAFVLLFGAGVPVRHLMGVALPVASLAILFIFSSDYRRARIFSFLDPFSQQNALGDGFQQVHSLYAIASGGWVGKGLGRSVEKFLYLPEPHTDFIFAIFTEEWGTIGGILLIILFAVLIWRAFRICTLLPDRFGALLAMGITATIGIPVVVNIAMVTGAFPVAGIPLPFITYGGTALLVKLASMGILLNLSRYTIEESEKRR